MMMMMTKYKSGDIKHEVSIALISRVQPTQEVICDVRLVTKGIHK